MTGMNSNIDDVVDKMREMKEKSMNIDFSEALIVGVNAARGRMSFRIFNRGLDSQGLPFGKYVGKKTIPPGTPAFTPYEFKRVSKGRQVAYKDLEFQGALRRGIQVIKKNNNLVVCAIVNRKLIVIAKGQEEQIGRIKNRGRVKIFSLSAEELQFLKTNTRAAIKQLYARIINTKGTI